MKWTIPERRISTGIGLFSFDTIGFTDFEEGSKSEIFRRCDIGASNENPASHILKISSENVW